jgi:hypothetical protein
MSDLTLPEIFLWLLVMGAGMAYVGWAVFTAYENLDR